MGGLEGLDEGAVVTDGDDRPRPAARCPRRPGSTPGRGCSSARRGRGDWPGRRPAWPGRAWPARRPTGFRHLVDELPRQAEGAEQGRRSVIDLRIESSMLSRVHLLGSTCSCSWANQPRATLTPSPPSRRSASGRRPGIAGDRLARPVAADDDDPVASAQREGHTPEDGSRSVVDLQGGHGHGRRRRPTWLGKRESGLALSLVDDRASVSSRLTRVSRDRAMRARRTVLPRMESARVVSRVISRLSRVADARGQLDRPASCAGNSCTSPCTPQRGVGQVEDLRDGLVQQLDVVADEEQGPVELFELVHEPLLGTQVEMVRRFVEHHDLGLLEQDPDEIEPAALASDRSAMSSTGGPVAVRARRPAGRSRPPPRNRRSPGIAPRSPRTVR